MIMRSIDSLGDWNFGKGKQSYNYQQAAIAENIQTRLLSFLNNCWFDVLAGIDWPRILGSKNTQQEIELRVRAAILQSYGVVRVNSIDINYQQTSRNITLQYSVDTIYSTGVINTVGVGNA